MTRDQKLKAVWRTTHRDYRGTLEGQRTILVLRQGGTTLVPLTDLTDAEIERKLPVAMRSGKADLPILEKALNGLFGGK